MLGIVGHQLDQALGAGLHAGAAGHTFLLVHHCHAVDDVDGAELAGFHAGAVAQTAVGTGLCAAAGGHDGLAAVVNTGINVLGLCLVAGSLTFHEGDLLLHRAGVHAHDGRDLLPHRSAAHGAGVDGSFAGGDGFGQGVTARVSAAAAVVARQLLADSRLLLIYFYLECLAEDAQSETDHDSHCGNYDSSNYNCRNIHFRLLPLQ